MTDLISLPIEMDHSQYDSRYRLVLLASQRARKILDGERPLVPSRSAKSTTLALEEVVAGRLQCLTGEQAKEARRELARQKRKAIVLAELPAEETPALEEGLAEDVKIYLEERRSKKPGAEGSEPEE
jgi:DNA-directed RNA polymerase subunit omega